MASGLNSPQHFEVGEWAVDTFGHSPIMASGVIETWKSQLKVTALPDMIFSGNMISLMHRPSQLVFDFIAYDALQEAVAEPGSSSPIASGKSATWKAERLSDGTCLKIHDHGIDWTYQTTYTGTLYRKDGDGQRQQVTVEATDVEIDYEMLKDTSQPILFSDSAILYEDELHDSGISRLSVRMRFMPKCWFVLLRHWLRVDEVVSQIFDTRVFHRLGDPFVLREITTKKLSLAPTPSCRQADVPFSRYDRPEEHEHLMSTVSKRVEKIHLSK